MQLIDTALPCRIEALMRLLAAALALCITPAAQPTGHLGKALPEWMSDLESAEGVTRVVAARSIGEMALAGWEGAERALIAAAAHRDGSVRFWAVTALARLRERSPQGLDTLRRALEDAVPEVRVQGARGLVGSPAERAGLDTLAELLSHPNPGVRLHAAHAADAIGDRAGPLADKLRAATSDPFDYVQRVARHALWTLGQRPCPYRECL